MRYEDASQSGSSNTENVMARDDADALAAGDRGPATGNVISGADTQTGALGADLGADGARIVAISGAQGSDTSFAGGKLSVGGEFGRLTIDAQGNYSYLANKDAPESSRDIFTYKLANAQGQNDSAALTIEIGKSPAVVQANAQRVIVGPDGVVVLPAGVELSDVRVAGRDLVVTLPDGTQMLIVDGAVFVPRLVLGDVEVPATNLAALLIDSEIRPAAGAPQSGGGNFEIPVGPLDPGVDLGDLIPPTELTYLPPQFEENGFDSDSEPSILIETPDQPAGVENATATVNENALPARGLEPAGSNSASTSETTTGTIVFESADAPSAIAVNGVLVTQVGQTIAGTYGTITITSIVDGAIGYSYTLGDNTLGDATRDLFTVTVTDRDGDVDTATLRIDIVDDAPVARPDVDSVTEDGALVADGNLVTGAGGSDANATDGQADTQGADGAFVSLVDGTNAGVGQVVPDADGEQIVGQYGTLTVFANGSYSYALNNANAAVQALTTGQTLTEAFAYTLTDNDGDSSASTLTITINGSNDVPTVTVPQVGTLGTVVSEAGLAARPGEQPGSAAATNAEITSGTITFTNGDGASTVTINGTAVVAGALIAGDYGTLRIDTVVGTTITYTYTLTDNVDHDSDATPFESFTVLVADSDGNPADDASATLRIDIVDDAPVARPDVDSVTEDGALVADGNLVTGAGGSDANATDGQADTQGADGAFVSLVDGTNAGVGQVVPDADGEQIVGQYGTLTVFANGSYSYALNNANAAVQALTTGQTLTEAFAYTLTDNDGDSSASTLTITINGSNDVPTVTVPQVGTLGTVVSEAGLAARPGEQPGSAAATNAEITSGTITFTNGDGASTVTINGTAVVAGALIAGDYGTLRIDTVVGTTITYTYTLTDNVDHDSDATPFESFTVLVADSDGNPADDASATLRIDIVDDAPVARPDVDSVTEDGALVADGNLVTGAGGSDANATDGQADTQGADGAFVSLVDGTNAGVGQVVPDADGEQIVGQYGTLTVFANGSYSYALNNANAAVQALTTGQTLTEAFAYTLTDNDGDSSASTLTITINGSNDVPTVTVPQVGTLGTVVSEAGLAARPGEQPGSAAATNAEITSGTITFTNGDGASTVTINGTAVVAGALIAGDYGTLRIDTVVGTTITYTYTLTDNVDHDSDATPFESFTVLVADSDGNPADDASATLRIDIVDDAPVARPDVDSVTEDGALVADGNLVTGAGGSDANATDGQADTQGADGAFVSLVDGTNAGVGQVVPDADGEQIVGQYGTLTVFANGSYSYALNNANAAVQALTTGQTLTEAFAYTLTDNDGDSSASTLTITINGSNDVPTVTVPQVGTLGTVVSEAGLAARPGEQPGSAAATNAEITSGTITFTNGDGASTVTINGTAVVAGALIAGDYGTLRIDTVVGTTITYTYTLTDNVDHDSDATPFESFTVLVADSDGNPADDASATLRIDIVDDAPVARPDVDSVTEDGALVADGNLVTGAGGSDANATDGQADTQGADGAFVSLVDGTNAGVGQVVPDADGEQIVGQYGTLTVFANGSYSYALNNANAAVQALTTGQTLTEAFAYTLTDNDGDSSASTLTITINGSNDVPTVTVPQVGTLGTVVSEAGLAARPGEQPGSAAATNAEITSGTITFTNGDGASTVTINGTAVVAGALIAGDYGTLRIDTVVGTTITYTYTLTDNVDHDSDATPFESFTVLVADSDGNPADDASATLRIDIVDDAPVARPDVDSVTEDGALVADGNLVTGAGGSDANATDGQADTQGADGAFVSLVDGTNAGVGQVVPDADGEQIVGQYGTLTVFANGSYSYALNNANAAVQALTTGQTLTEAFAYTLTDNDGDSSASTLTITINGSNDVPTVTVPQVGTLGTVVSEAGLAARPGEQPGSAAATNAEITSGTITFTNGDGASTVTINGTAVVAGALIAGDYGTLRIDTVVGTTITYTYTLTDNVDHDSDATPFESFTVLVADSDGNPADDASATLRIDIVDDAPVARPDVDSVTEDGALVADGNLVTGAGGSDANATDGQADTQGADGAFVSLVDGTNAGVGQVVPDADGEQIVGQYGTLTVFANGSYSYALNNANAAVQALTTGQTLTEAFAYTLTDNDGDSSASTLTITINGSNDVPTVTVPQVGTLGTVVSEAGLAARPGEQPGSAAATNAEITSGTITFTNGDGASTVTINGTAVVAGALIAGDYGTLRIDTVVGTTITYTYTLTDNVDHDSDATPFESFTVLVADSDGNPADDASATLRIDIVDDAPVARPDVDSVTEDGALVADGNLVTGAGGSDANATDGQADTQGADGAFVSLVDGTNAGVGQVVPDADGEQIVGQYGTLTVFANGSYSYALNNANAAVQALTTGQTLTEAFAYTLTDNDGDSSASTLTITINGSNDVPTVTVPQVGTLGTVVSEAGLAARPGEQPGSAAATNAEITSGTITFTNGDGASTVTINGTAVVAGALIAGDYGTLRIDTVVGTTITYTYTLTDNVDHDSDATPFESFTVLVADSDGNPADDASATLRIDIVDDAPVAAISATNVSLIHDETPGVQADTDFAGVLTVSASNPGNDPDVAGTGPIGYARSATALSSAGSITGADSGTIVISLTLVSQGVDSGLATTEGTSIFLFKEGTTIVGRVGTTAALAETGVAAFAIAVGAGNMLEMAQYLSIRHPTGGTASPDEMVTIANDAIRATTTVTDNDGDVSIANVSIGSQIGFQDDAPTLTSVTDLLVPNQVNHSITGNIGFSYGADGPGAITLTAPTIDGLTFQTDPLTGKITAFAGATAYFSVVVDQTTGQYTLDMLSTRPVVSTPINFATIAPGNYDTVTIGSAVFNGLVFNGTLATQFTNPSNSTDTINPSGNGFGTGNNLVNDNEGFLFSYPDASALTFSLNFQPNTDTATVSWVAYTSDPLTGGTPIESGSSIVSKLGDADGIVPVTLDPALNFNFLVVRVDITSGTGARVQDFAVTRDVIPANQVISFGVRVTDGDGDLVIGTNGTEPDTSLDLTFLGGPPLAPAASLMLNSDDDIGGDVLLAGGEQFAYVNDNGQTSTGQLADISFRTADRDSDLAQRLAGAATNTGVVTAAIAAMGLAASQAAANVQDAAPLVSEAIATSGPLEGGATDAQNSSATVDAPRSLLGNESRVAADDAVDSDAGQAASADAKLADPAIEAAAPTDLPSASEPASHDSVIISPVAPMIVMPSADSLVAMAGAADTGDAQRAITVEKVLAEALHGGTGVDDVDALLAGLGNHGDGANAALAALATPHGADVSAWDMGGGDGLSAVMTTNIVADMTVFHHDAVQPAING